MIRIGLISDTHGNMDERFFKFFDKCDEIWHAGDIGNINIVNKIESFKPLRAVYGNIDGTEIRSFIPEIQKIFIENSAIFMVHIGGYPGRYDNKIKSQLYEDPPNIFISGHSHILKVIHDKKLNLLHINPGAAGKSGLHKVRTAVRFIIDSQGIRDLEIMELARN